MSWLVKAALFATSFRSLTPFSSSLFCSSVLSRLVSFVSQVLSLVPIDWLGMVPVLGPGEEVGEKINSTDLTVRVEERLCEALEEVPERYQFLVLVLVDTRRTVTCNLKSFETNT